MRMQGLSFDNIPAMHIPFRFFNTAPWMGVLAAVALMTGAEAGLHSQWTPSLLAATHFITLGFMSTVMLGALFQLLPVISGFQIPYTPYVATVVHLALLIGVPFLSLGFLFEQYELFWFAVPILLAGFVIFLSAFGKLLVARVSGGDSIFTVRFAALSLLITIILGVCRAAAYLGYPILSNIPNLTYVHLSWGLVGWVLLLVMGVSYQVIPMFHVTPGFPSRITRMLPVVIFIVLLLLTVNNSGITQAILLVVLFLSVNVYACSTLLLLTKRKRKIKDITVSFWRVAMVSLIVASLLLLCRYFLPLVIELSFNWQIMHMIVGITIVFGFACSVIIGMLQKIVPFLLYMHMQLQCKGDIKHLKVLPNMHEIISAKQSAWQLRLHLAAYMLLVSSVIEPSLIYISSLAMALDFCWLGYSVARATRKYIVVLSDISTAS